MEKIELTQELCDKIYILHRQNIDSRVIAGTFNLSIESVYRVIKFYGMARNFFDIKDDTKMINAKLCSIVV